MNKTVYFDLTNYDFSDANVYEDSQLLHQSKMDQIMEMWRNLYRKADSPVSAYGLGQDVVRSHNTISITANRGAGKTTFLLSVLNKIKKEWGDDVLCLSPIDPSLVDVKQHPFINLIAAIQEYVEDKIQRLDSFRSRSIDFEQHAEFNDCYRLMLKALPFIDGIGKPHVYDEWDDEDFVSAQGMERAEASNNLEKYFHNYVRLALAILKKKCLVISFDDIDIDFKKGVEVLETIRKYLTSCQIIVLVTGDLELYGKLVRKATWQCFDMTFLKQETEYGMRNKKEFGQIVDQLENQYLVKLLKPEYRIKLPTLWEYISEENCDIRVRIGQLEPCTIGELYELCLSKLGFYNRKVKKEISHFLLGLPLRVQIRLLSLLHRVLSRNKDLQEQRLMLAEGFMSIFWNDINQKSSHAKNLVKKLPVYSVELLSFLIENNVLFSNSNLLPETNDVILNKALLAIGVQFNQLLSTKSYLIFDYWLRISYTRFALEKCGGKEREEIDRFLSYTYLDADMGLNKSYGLSLAYCNATLKSRPESQHQQLPGSIFIGYEPPLLFANFNNSLKTLPMVGTVDLLKRENVFVSIYQLFAVLRELLAAVGTDEEYILTEFNKLAQYRNYQEPRVAIYNLEENDSISSACYGIIYDKDEDKMSALQLIKDFDQWSSLEVSVTCQFLDRVFTRFYYTLLHIDQNKQNNLLDNVGDRFSLYIIALLNAALVEEAIESQAENLDFNNVGDIERIYFHNLQMMSKNKKSDRSDNDGKIGLHSWLQKCPLLLPYINPLLIRLIHTKKVEASEEQSLWEQFKYSRLVNELSIYENKLAMQVEQLEVYSLQAEWIDLYYAYRDVHDESLLLYNLSKKGNVPAETVMNRIALLKEEKEKLVHKIKEIEIMVPYTYKTKTYHIDEWFNSVGPILRKIEHEVDETKKHIEKIKAKIESFSTIVREDYEITQKKYSKSFFSVYESLRKISF